MARRDRRRESCAVYARGRTDRRPCALACSRRENTQGKRVDSSSRQPHRARGSFLACGGAWWKVTTMYNLDSAQALTLTQPHATLCALDAKRIETRNWKPA